MNFIERLFENISRINDGSLVSEVHQDTFYDTSARELKKWCDQARHFFAAHGVKKGDRVALLAPNSSKWVALDLAMLRSGIISVPLYSRQDPKELAGILKDCDPVLLIVADQDLKKGVLQQWTRPEKTFLFDQIFSTQPVMVSEPMVDVKPSDIITIVYTSGTSGEPKGVMLTRANVDFMIEQTTTTLERTRETTAKTDRIFHFLPCCFLGSRLMMWTQIYRGNPFMFSTDLKNLAQEMAAADPSYFLTVPAVLERIRNAVVEKIKKKGGIGRFLYQKGKQEYPNQSLLATVSKWVVFNKIRNRIGDNLQFIICGSAPLSAECQEWFEMIGIPILQVYGLTETSGILTMDQKTTAKGGTVGVVIEGCEAKISPEGELICRGPNLFSGYWNKPKESKEMIRDGWLYTGDQAEIDSEGRLKIMGRMKNVIIPTSGHNIAPEPLEQKLVETCPGAEHAFVVGHGKPFLSVLITGNVTEKDLEQAVDELNVSVPHYKKIKKYKVMTDEHFTIENGMLTANQKVRRKAIETKMKETIDEFYQTTGQMEGHA